MAERAVPRVTRLLGIVSFLERNGETSFADLAAQFDVSEDQIRKDIATLWVSGLPGYMPHELLDFDADLYDAGIASLTEGQGVTQVRLSARESVALLGALAAMSATGAAPDVVNSAIAKIKAAVGDEAIATISPARVDTEVVSALHSAIATRSAVTLDYTNARDQRSVRTVEPHRIVTIGDAAYLECWCRKAEDYRTLRIDRIATVTPTGESVEHPPSDEGGFSLAPVYEATVRAERDARRVFEDLPGVEIAVDGDHIVARFGVADEAYVAARLLTVAPHLASVEPAALRAAFAASARSVLASLN